MKNLLFFVMFVIIAIESNAQYTCGTDERHAWLLKHDPEYARMMQNRKPLLRRSFRPAAVPDTIPVVVHVLYIKNIFGVFGNMSDSSIADMMDTLNQSFNAPRADGVNIGLHFKLAQTDPFCRPTNGIVRIDASNDNEYFLYGVRVGNESRGISDEALKEKSFWDNTKYMNIWIVIQINDHTIAGYSNYPTGLRTTSDGIVLDYRDALYSVVHEMGHSFNLLHTFYGASGDNCPSNNDCASDGDMICDTPPVPQNGDCDPLAVNPCTNVSYGSNATYNYMSYNGCRHLFTPMQNERMLDALYTYRSSLLTSNTEQLPPQAPLLNIVSDDADNIIDPKQIVTFTPTVTGSSAPQYHWFKNKYEVSTNQFYNDNKLLHGDEIVCMIVATDLVCHVPVTSYSNTIKISTDRLHLVSIYPNPCSDRFKAWTPSSDVKINKIRVIGLDGKILETQIVIAPSVVQYSLAGRFIFFRI
jgi:hypothetical protein